MQYEQQLHGKCVHLTTVLRWFTSGAKRQVFGIWAIISRQIRTADYFLELVDKWREAPGFWNMSHNFAADAYISLLSCVGLQVARSAKFLQYERQFHGKSVQLTTFLSWFTSGAKRQVFGIWAIISRQMHSSDSVYVWENETVTCKKGLFFMKSQCKKCCIFEQSDWLLQKVYVFHDSWLQIGIIFGQLDSCLQKGYAFHEKSVQKVQHFLTIRLITAKSVCFSRQLVANRYHFPTINSLLAKRVCFSWKVAVIN